jgi:osmoprotectant transport system permease protein
VSFFSIPSYVGTFSDLLTQHLTMALSSVGTGLLISLPVGLACARFRRLYPPVLAVASALYSIPSLAFFVLLIGSTGLHETTVIIPLTIYSLAVLIPNVVDGLRAVPEETRQAAEAMGFSRTRRLVQVELPVALPTVMAGLRVAAVASVSMVSVGAVVGIGGFGAVLTAGENPPHYNVVWTGIIVIVAMALVIDVVLLVVQWGLTPWARRARSGRQPWPLSTFQARRRLALATAGSTSSTGSGSGPTPGGAA